MNEPTPKVSVGTWIRTAALLVTLINSLLVGLGHAALPITEDNITAIVDSGYAFYSILATAIAAIWAWWRNNSFTKSARIKDAERKIENK
ncbi:hypothetical protein [Microcystis phage MaeS]|nr:hypothetical protein [Microcystis phage MaeS]